MFIGRSTQNKQGDRHERRANQRTNESIFRGRRTGETYPVEVLLDEWSKEEGEARADENRDEHQTDLAVVVVVQFSEDDRVGEEEGVEHAVDEHDVHAHEVEDGFGEDHGDRADETGADDIVQSEFVFLLLGDDVGVSGLFAETGGAAFQDHGGVGLWDETDEDHYGAAEGHVSPEEEIETVGADGDPAADYGADDGPAVGGCGEEGDGHAAVFEVPNVGDGAAGEREAGAGEDAAEEAADEEAADVGREGAGDVEDGVEGKGDDVDGTAADDLGERRPEERADCEAADHDGAGEGRDFERNVIFLFDEAEAAGDDGGAVGNADDEKGGDHCDVPAVRAGPVEGVLGIIDGEGHEFCWLFGFFDVGAGCVM